MDESLEDVDGSPTPTADRERSGCCPGPARDLRYVDPDHAHHRTQPIATAGASHPGEPRSSGTTTRTRTKGAPIDGYAQITVPNAFQVVTGPA